MIDEELRIGAGEPETPDRDGAFPRLDENQLELMRSHGRLRPVEPGEVLFAEGDEGSDFFVLESGVRDDRPGLRQGKPGHSRPWAAPLHR